MTVQVYSSVSAHHDYTNVKTAAITDEGVVNLIFTDTYGAKHSVQEQSDFQIVITKPAAT